MPTWAPISIKALAYFTAFPYGQSTIDRAIRGDYLNQFIIFDFTVPRLKKTLFLGTSWGQEGAKLVPAPGDPWYATYTYDPMNAPFTPPPKEVAISRSWWTRCPRSPMLEQGGVRCR